MNSGDDPVVRRIGDAAVLVAVATCLSVGAWMWASGQLAGWLASGRWPAIPVWAGVAILTHLPSHLTDPRAAWPATVRGRLPGPALLYGCALVVLVGTGTTGWLAVRLGVALARRIPGRRPGWPGGIRTPVSHRRTTVRGAHWAGRGDTRDLRVRRSNRASRLILGRRSGSSRFGCTVIATEARHSVLVVGPTQSGKTTGLAVPALLEWRGPVIATSVKDDLAASHPRLAVAEGPCWVFDPTRSSGLGGAGGLVTHWPICVDWSAAQRLAGWLVEATPARTGMSDAAFWYAAAAKQLGPLLLAAERSAGDHGRCGPVDQHRRPRRAAAPARFGRRARGLARPGRL